MRSICAKVPKVAGDDYRKKLHEAQFIDSNLIIRHNDRFLYIPLQTQPSEQWLNENKEIELEEGEFESYPLRVKDYRELMDIPANLVSYLPRSYDIIGSIAILKLPLQLENYGHQIGEAIIKSQKNIRTVALDRGVKGQERIRDLQLIAGDPSTITVHIEYGVKLYMDIMKAYFSPRLSSEHYRVSKLVQPGETILDMFAGVGPFSIMISKHSLAERIYSIDINKHAIEYLIKNIDMNKARNIFPLEGDAKDLIKRIPPVDRIIMNLPKSGSEYLLEAFAILKPNGTIHYHELISLDAIPERELSLRETAKNHGYKVLDLNQNNLGSYSPSLYHFCFDIQLKINV